ncbi:hypothetical protein [Lewinella sp. LCG006]|uniref:hypothetical protein n=1 Tax=Lewinella sp. LCG006 TaxID=3231911 RepID=UPI00345FAB44
MYALIILLLILLMQSVFMIGLWKILKRNIEETSRFGRIFVLSSILFLLINLIWIDVIGLNHDYLGGSITEIIGILITLIIVDRVYNYFQLREEALYRKLAYKMCKQPIRAYCTFWLYIYNGPQNGYKEKIDENKYNSFNSFFMSRDFYNKAASFNFATLLDEKTTNAEYYASKFEEVAGKFQDVIAKYGSKLHIKDLELIEHFGGSSFMFSVFTIQKMLSEVKVSSSIDSNSENKRFTSINKISDIEYENFKKHFKKLIQLIDNYNEVISDCNQEWTISKMNSLDTVKGANYNEAIEW